MRISEAHKALTEHYRNHKLTNGGHKTAPKGKYGFKSIQYKLVDADGTEYGPFGGRGSVLNAYQSNVKKAGKPTSGVKFIVQEIFKPKNKTRGIVVDSEIIFELTDTKKVKA